MSMDVKLEKLVYAMEDPILKQVSKMNPRVEVHYSVRDGWSCSWHGKTFIFHPDKPICEHVAAAMALCIKYPPFGVDVRV